MKIKWQHLFFLYLVSVTVLMFSLPVLRAESITTADGTIHEGDAVAEDQNVIFFKSGSEILEIRKADIRSRATSEATPAPARPVEPKLKPQENGGGPLTEMEKMAKAQMKDWEQILNDRNRMEEMHARSKALMEQLQPILEKLREDPALRWIFNMAYEAQAKTRLRKLASVSAIYTVEHDREPSGLSELVSSGLIEKEFTNNGYDDYRYSISSSQNGYDIEATPLNPKFGLKGFVYHSLNDHIDER